MAIPKLWSTLKLKVRIKGTHISVTYNSQMAEGKLVAGHISETDVSHGLKLSFKVMLKSVHISIA